jgi:hypothetical protein
LRSHLVALAASHTGYLDLEGAVVLVDDLRARVRRQRQVTNPFDQTMKV